MDTSSFDGDADALNKCRVDPRLKQYAVDLRLGRRVDLIAETHDGDDSTFSVRRRPRIADPEAA